MHTLHDQGLDACCVLNWLLHEHTQCEWYRWDASLRLDTHVPLLPADAFCRLTISFSSMAPHTCQLLLGALIPSYLQACSLEACKTDSKAPGSYMKLMHLSAD